MFDRELNMVQLEALSGVSRKTISKMMKNHTINYNSEVLDKLCKTLNCNVGDILSYIPDKEEKAA